MILAVSAPEVDLPALDARPARRERLSPPADAGRLAGSVGVHLALFAAILFVAVPARLPPIEENAVETEVIDARAFDALRGVTPAPSGAARSETPLPAPDTASEALPSARPTSMPPPVAAVPGTAARPVIPDMIQPSRMLSDLALGQPHNRGLRRELGRLVDEDRIAQLCDLEAMEQIHAWQADFQPDRLVDYALSDTRMEGTTLIAHGGAFRNQRKWYEVSYRCELDAGLRKVVGFAFRVGAAIPREEWATDNLPSLH
ncbi:DUF930 domain-containing protein [Ancylobacter amanitiformis]|uniref:DUF930 domain-containing protein n=1 Tax=Ancylobacter amanitiformis TaxID=217069 RepID=A0ABU0LLA3_9HYPH|nr:DUF930 domain-containing protein [Ancylobacter amanitiformis]MDQ0509476.1 hypothetical protein [Ancylobacter amanitiformis]